MAEAGERVTVGELGRRLDKLEKQIDDRFIGLHRRFDDLAFVPVSLFEEARRTEDAEHRLLRQRIETAMAAAEKTAENLRWVVRALAGAILPMVLAALVAVSR